MNAPASGPDAPSGDACRGVAGVADDAVDERGRRYALEPGGVRVTSPDGRSRWLALDDPAAPRFTALPDVAFDDGRRLREAAFLVWSAHVRTLLAAGRRFETSYRPRRPFHTAFGIAGGLVLGAGTIALLGRFANAPRRVWIEPNLAQWAVLLGALALALWVANESLSAAARIWLCRRGSFVAVGADGVVLTHGGRPRPFASVRDAIDHPWVRATELVLSDGKRLWVPRERGPLGRLDLVLAAVDDGVRESALRRL